MLANKAQRSFSTAVFLWANASKGIGKTGSTKVKFEMPKGLPRRIEAFDDLKIKEIRIGLRHSAAITEDGDLYTFGQGNWGVLGHGTEQFISFNKPKLVEGLKEKNIKVKDVQLGEYHTMVLAEDGSVWTWGYAGKKGMFNWMYAQEVGALGHGDKEPHFYPKRVDWFRENKIKIAKIAAGNYHCVAIDTKNRMYNWGKGQYGVLGNGDTSESMLPQLNEEFEFIKQQCEEEAPGSFGFKKIHSSDNYTAAVLKDGTIFTWGMNDRGQLGVGNSIGMDMVESENQPKELSFTQSFPGHELHNDPVFIQDVYCGQNTMIMRDHENNVFKTGNRLDYIPKKIPFDDELLPPAKIDQIASGRSHFSVIDTDHNIHTFGNVFKGKEIG